MTHLPGWRLMDRKVSTALIKMEKIRHVKKNPFGHGSDFLRSCDGEELMACRELSG
jgi:hypothetical protein